MVVPPGPIPITDQAADAMLKAHRYDASGPASLTQIVTAAAITAPAIILTTPPPTPPPRSPLTTPTLRSPLTTPPPRSPLTPPPMSPLLTPSPRSPLTPPASGGMLAAKLRHDHQEAILAFISNQQPDDAKLKSVSPTKYTGILPSIEETKEMDDLVPPFAMQDICPEELLRIQQMKRRGRRCSAPVILSRPLHDAPNPLSPPPPLKASTTDDMHIQKSTLVGSRDDFRQPLKPLVLNAPIPKSRLTVRRGSLPPDMFSPAPPNAEALHLSGGGVSPFSDKLHTVVEGFYKPRAVSSPEIPPPAASKQCPAVAPASDPDLIKNQMVNDSPSSRVEKMMNPIRVESDATSRQAGFLGYLGVGTSSSGVVSGGDASTSGGHSWMTSLGFKNPSSTPHSGGTDQRDGTMAAVSPKPTKLKKRDINAFAPISM